MEKDTYPNPKVVGLAKKMVPVMIDTDKDPATGQQFNVEGLPTILFLKPDGSVIHTIGGYMPPGPFAKEMQIALNKAKGKPAASRQ